MATDAGTPAEPAAGLQFDNVEHATPGGAGACARCTRQITDEYFEIGGNLLCPSCATELRGGEGGAGPFLRALGFGAGAAVVSTIVWYLIVKATNYEIGLIAVAVGLFIGVAVRKGSRGRGGWKYQALAIALTYGAITASKIPFIIDAVRDQAAKKQTAGKQADPAPADAKQADKPAAADADANKPPTAGQVFLAFALLFGLALASPFLGGFDNIIGILIIGFALYEAWKMNRRLPVNGPFRLAAATPALQT